MDLIQPVSRLSWPVLEDLLSDSEGIFQISCQSLTCPFPFFRKVKERKKKDPFYTKTRLTRYLCNLISQNSTNKSQRWLHELIQFLKVSKLQGFLSTKNTILTKLQGFLLTNNNHLTKPEVRFSYFSIN